VVRHYDFYSAFATPPEYDVIHNGTTLGTLPVRYLPDLGEHIIFAAKRWQVSGVDTRRGQLLVVPAAGRKRPKFQGAGGEIHATVREEMHDVLTSDKEFSYLNADANNMLSSARRSAREAGLLESDLISLPGECTVWFTWTSSRVHRTLNLMARSIGLTATDREIALDVRCRKEELTRQMTRFLDSPPTAESLAKLIEPKIRRKYDGYLDEDILVASLADEAIDVSHAIETIRHALWS
jgi:ATP-dependent helicase Lhr and Lhr-like helicase